MPDSSFKLDLQQPYKCACVGVAIGYGNYINTMYKARPPGTDSSLPGTPPDQLVLAVYIMRNATRIQKPCLACGASIPQAN
eukprot:6182054-Pleurochrysis_carterae.AAC.1